MPVFKSFLGLLFVFLLAICFVGYFLPKPSTICIQKELACSPEHIFTQVNNLKNWDQWATWNQKDPNMTKSYNSIPEGKGAQYVWKGNWRVAEGKVEIKESIPNSLVIFQLFFDTEHTNISEFKIKPNGTGSLVDWSLNIQPLENVIIRNLFGGYHALLMKRLVLRDYEDGLDNMGQNCQK